MAAQYGFPDQMQRDIDAMGGGNAATAAGDGPILPPPGIQGQPDPAALMQSMMQNMMQSMMQAMMASFQQAASGAAATGTSPPAAYSPQGGVHWRQDPHMANVRLDERAFRRLEKFTNKKDAWKERRTQFLTAVR